MKLNDYIRIFFISITVLFTMQCTPDKNTQDEREAVKGDTLNVREGEGEGTVGEGDIGS